VIAEDQRSARKAVLSVTSMPPAAVVMVCAVKLNTAA
jgi:hypothetical protein